MFHGHSWTHGAGSQRRRSSYKVCKNGEQGSMWCCVLPHARPRGAWCRWRHHLFAQASYTCTTPSERVLDYILQPRLQDQSLQKYAEKNHLDIIKETGVTKAALADAISQHFSSAQVRNCRRDDNAATCFRATEGALPIRGRRHTTADYNSARVHY